MMVSVVICVRPFVKSLERPPTTSILVVGEFEVEDEEVNVTTCQRLLDGGIAVFTQLLQAPGHLA